MNPHDGPSQGSEEPHDSKDSNETSETFPSSMVIESTQNPDKRRATKETSGVQVLTRAVASQGNSGKENPTLGTSTNVKQAIGTQNSPLEEKTKPAEPRGAASGLQGQKRLSLNCLRLPSYNCPRNERDPRKPRFAMNLTQPICLQRKSHLPN